jgi:hypothetical protein
VGCGVWGVGCGVWGVGCGVWGVGCGVWGVGRGGVRGLAHPSNRAHSSVVTARLSCPTMGLSMPLIATGIPRFCTHTQEHKRT